MKLLSQIKKTLLYSTTINDDDGKIRRKLMIPGDTPWETN